MRQNYTFIEAQNYIYQNWPSGSSVLMGPNITYSVPIQRNQASIQRARDLGAPNLESWAWWLRQPISIRLHEYNIYGPEFEQAIATYADVQHLIVDQHIQYVIEIDTCTGTEARASATSAQEFPPINQGIRQSLQLIKTFSPFKNEVYCPAPIYDRTTILNRDDVQYFMRPGPIIRLFQTTDGISTMPTYF